jgi:nucleoside-diphosphate-sugar epimerase
MRSPITLVKGNAIDRADWSRLMRVLFVGGTGMTGPFAIRRLLAGGHDVTLLHRSHSRSPLLDGATQIVGDKSGLPGMRRELAALGLDVIIHMVAYNEADAAALVESAAGIVPRAVVVSSCDVYRSYGRLHRAEMGPPNLTPANEDAPLRTKLRILGGDYEKITVERIAQSDPRLRCTVLRYPAVYGPGDGQHRLGKWVRRMDDRRPYILLGQDQANWRFAHGYVENVADALIRTITHPDAAGRVYNVGDAVAPTWIEWIRRVGRACNWAGDVIALPTAKLPIHLAHDLDFSHDLTIDTTRIRAELGYVEPVPADEALRQAIGWEREHAPLADLNEYAAEDAAAVGHLPI